MAKLAGGNIILGYSVEKNILTYGSQCRVRVPVSLGYGRQRGDISTQLTPRVRQYLPRSGRHILEREWIVPRSIQKPLELNDDIFLVLSSQPRRNASAFKIRVAVAKRAISYHVSWRIDWPCPARICPAGYMGFFRIARSSKEWSRSNRQDRHCQLDELHDPGFPISGS